MSTRVDNKHASELSEHQLIVNRLLGVYPQKQDGLYMQRIKVLGGRINWPQWRKITQLAEAYSAGFPLHITTRQDIELHNILVEDVPAVHKGLTEAALASFGAGGDSVRNVTVCTGCELCCDKFDLMPLAQLVCRHLEKRAVILNLPRKFKISFSGCGQACAKPWLNDLGFIAQPEGVFTVIGAGSLGPKPAMGIQLYEDLPANHVLPLCVAAIEFFQQCGNRENRHRARFRHLREKLGNRAFQAELDVRFRQQRAQQFWPEVSPAPGSKNRKMLCRLQLPNGNISPEEACQLADVAEPERAALRINLEHGLELYGAQPIQLPGKLASLMTNPIVTACPGSAACSRGLANCWATADRIRQAFAGQNSPRVRINISGCPNNCAHSAVADIGLVGLLRKQKGKRIECYRVFTGGGNGKNDRLAKRSETVCARDVPATIKRLLKNARRPSI